MREPRRKGAADASSSTPIYKERRIGTRYYGGETPEPKTKKKYQQRGAMVLAMDSVTMESVTCVSPPVSQPVKFKFPAFLHNGGEKKETATQRRLATRTLFT